MYLQYLNERDNYAADDAFILMGLGILLAGLCCQGIKQRNFVLDCNITTIIDWLYIQFVLYPNNVFTPHSAILSYSVVKGNPLDHWYCYL